jgi:hypothetical protein
MDRPLVIINFQGVLGDFLRDKLDPLQINLRVGAKEGLKLLTNHF